LEPKSEDASPEAYGDPTRAEIPLKLTRDTRMRHNPGRVDALGVIAFACPILRAASAFSRGYSRTLKPAQVESDFSFISFRPRAAAHFSFADAHEIMRGDKRRSSLLLIPKPR
jgi:hypothetical protein